MTVAMPNSSANHNPPRIMTRDIALRLIRDWLIRQANANRHDAPHVNINFAHDTIIDGHVNIEELADSFVLECSRLWRTAVGD